MFKSALSYVGLYFALIILYILSILPRVMINIMGDIIGTILFYLLKYRTNVGIINLGLCFDNMSEVEKRKFILKHYKEFARSILDYGLLFFANKTKMKRFVKVVQGQDVFEKYVGKVPVILLAPHFTGLEFTASMMSIDYPSYSMYSAQKNAVIDKRLLNARTRFMKHAGGIIFPRTAGIKIVVKSMREKMLPFYYLPDQDISDKGRVFVPFFHHPSCPTVDALPKLAKITNAIVIPIMPKREKDGTYGIHIYPPIENYPTDNVLNDVSYMNQAIEKLIMDNPYQYFWLHKRFKNQPDKQVNAYYNQHY